MASTRTAMKQDTVLAAAVELARTAAQSTAGDFGVGQHLGHEMQGERVLSHFFDCPHPGYVGWRWAVTLTRPPRARTATVDEVSLIPGPDSLKIPEWIPWSDRVKPGDVTPGALLPTPDNDPRLEPGFIADKMGEDDDPAEWSETRAIVTDLGLGRERILSPEGRDEAAQRWYNGEGGCDNASTERAQSQCLTCGYYLRLSGPLGNMFGVCTNEFTPRDGKVVSSDHGCGAHSDVVADERGILLPEPVYDTLTVDQWLFD